MNKQLLVSSSQLSPRIPSFDIESSFAFDDSLVNFNTTANYNFTSTTDGPAVVKAYNNFTVNSGHTVTVSNRCKGLYLYIKGDLIVNGTLSMTARGCKGTGKYVVVDYKKKRILYFPQDYDENKLLEFYDKSQIIYPVGGLGVATGSSPGVNGACGSGGAEYTKVYRGGNGTSFSGGAGAGGPVYSSAINNSMVVGWNYGKIGDQHYCNAPAIGTYTTQGADNGGLGGASCKLWIDHQQNWSGGGGAGNPAGYSYHYSSQSCSNNTQVQIDSGTGGLLILIVNGNVNITGSIISKGVQGKSAMCDGDAYKSSIYRCGGGGSGGGAIHIFYRGTLTGSDKISVAGGAQGASMVNKAASTSYQSYAGGRGSINLIKI